MDNNQELIIKMRNVFGKCHPAIEEARLSMYVNRDLSFEDQKRTEEMYPNILPYLIEVVILNYEAKKNKDNMN